jgi:XTP/dITP diphosphohydrolase
MHNLIFATNNLNKAEEVKAILGANFIVKTLSEEGIFIDIPEPFDTIEENATQKSSVAYDLTKKDCFGEDTGLEVDALNGAPGVRSARYADDGAFDNNIDKLLYNLRHAENRRANFKTVISLMLNGNEYTFEGICKGTIIANRRGKKGFGYDSVFVPEGSAKTFAEMEMDEKNFYSHRKKAVDKLVEFLNRKTNYS